MGLRRGDLRDTILSKISIDQFEPKTGDLREVVVVGFYLNEDGAAKDLYEYLNSSSMVFRDIEVSPNPNPDNYYMVFVEMDRGEDTLPRIQDMLGEVSNVSGDFAWRAQAHGMDDYVSINDDSLNEVIQRGPQLDEPKEPPMNDQVQEFLTASDLSEAHVQTGVLTLRRGKDTVKLDLVDFGSAHRVMHEHKLTESAINPDLDPSLIRKLNRMLGEMAALPVGRNVVIYNPQDESQVLITSAR